MDIRRDVLEFWFGADGDPAFGRHREQWFKASDAFDAEIRTRFLGMHEAVAAGRHDALARDAKGSLALIVVLDQFPRNMFRGTPRAFASDAKALALAEAAVDRGFDQELVVVERQFMYLPFEHSEVLADQDRSVALFRTLGDATLLDYARRHRDIVARFGRFPHRNAILGRASTPEEEAFLREPGSSF